MARDVRWCSQSKPWVIWRTVLVLEYSCLPENQVFMHCFRISRWAISYLLTIPNTPNGIPYCSSILTFPRQWLWKNFHEILNSKFLNWEYSTLTTEVVFSFGGINVLPTLLVDFHSRGVLARALVSFTWRSYLFIIFFYVAWQRRESDVSRWQSWMGQCHGHIRPCHSDLISFYLPHLRFAITLKFHQRNCRILTPPPKKNTVSFFRRSTRVVCADDPRDPPPQGTQPYVLLWELASLLWAPSSPMRWSLQFVALLWEVMLWPVERLIPMF